MIAPIIDVSWKSLNTRAGIAWFCLDGNNNKVMQNAVVMYPLPNAMIAEATACLKAICWVAGYGLQCITVKIDYQVLVRLLQKVGRINDWQIETTNNIMYYSKFFWLYSIEKLGRNVVQPAHELAIDVLKFYA